MTDGVARRAGAGALRGGLRLLAHEPDDVEIFSALLQDAAARPEDARWLKAERRFLLPLQRFRWEAEGRDERVSAALAVENVISARSRGVTRPTLHAVRLGDAKPKSALNLLSLEFRRDPPSGAGEENLSPGGELLIHCSAGAAFSLRVESLEASLTDLSEPRRAAHRPRHATAQAEPRALKG